jgi:hypothetical protein
MDLCNGDFETKVVGSEFSISITEESDISSDGGYTFHRTTNEWSLDKEDAKTLFEELKAFLGE